MALAPVSVAAVSAIPVGTAGAAVSTVKIQGVDAVLTLPAVSVAVARTVCGPSCSGPARLYCQAPVPSAVVVPTAVPSI
ncbi:hypothetical protein B2M27_21885 [Kluyvera intermedia]|uniref:Uncharacterized protein n=1 Tax=Kluyvera intermedia TaxID=61648 RepID=A0ABX3U9H4_KLUIN|nr:hypothetical protein B2M27_21885 [Kluyvera intermedia]